MNESEEIIAFLDKDEADKLKILCSMLHKLDQERKDLLIAYASYQTAMTNTVREILDRKGVEHRIFDLQYRYTTHEGHDVIVMPKEKNDAR